MYCLQVLANFFNICIHIMIVLHLSTTLPAIGLVFIEDVEVVPILKGAALAIAPEALVTVVVPLERLAIEPGAFVLLGEPPKLNPADGNGLLAGDAELVDAAVLIANRPGVGVDAGELAFGVAVATVVALLMGPVAVKDTGLVDPIDTGILLIVEGVILATDVVETLVDITSAK